MDVVEEEMKVGRVSEENAEEKVSRWRRMIRCSDPWGAANRESRKYHKTASCNINTNTILGSQLYDKFSKCFI